MAYVAWSVVFGETPSASKWNILGTNDSSFNDGSGIADGALQRLRNIVYFTSSGTYTKPAGMTSNGFVICEVVGGGGGGGGNIATGAGTVSMGGGGGSGGFSRRKVAGTSLGATETVTVGASGAVTSGANGSAGGNSSFGTWAVGNGGAGGVVVSGGTGGGIFQPGSAGGTATAGDLNVQGGNGGMTGSVNISINVCYGGFGGNTPYGYGMGGPSVSANNAGQAGQLYGGGGGGAAGATSVPAQAGGLGGKGIVIVYEYY